MGNAARRALKEFDFAAQRRSMVEHHIAGRGVRSQSVLRAMGAVRREAFLPPDLYEFAYEDFAAAHRRRPDHFSAVYRRVHGRMRCCSKAARRFSKSARAQAMRRRFSPKLRRMSIRSSGLGSWPKRPPPRWPSWATTMCMSCMATGHAAGRSMRPMMRLWSRQAAPRFRNRSKQQLKVGGRLVIPVGSDQRAQELVRVTTISADRISARRSCRRAFCSAARQGRLGGRETKLSARRSFRPCAQSRAVIGENDRQRGRAVRFDRHC